MKRFLLCCALTVFAGSVVAAEPDLKEEVLSAAKALSDSDNYSWTLTSETQRGDNSFQLETEGKTEKEGFTQLTITRDDNAIEIVLKGDKGAIETDAGWKSLAELSSDTNAENQSRFVVRMAQNFRTPAEVLEQALAEVEKVEKTGDEYVCELSAEGVKNLLSFRPRSEPVGGIQVGNGRGTFRVTVKDGAIEKFKYEVSGTVTFQDQTGQLKRITEVQLKDIGTTKLSIPDDIQAKVQ
jgi:hypothetical protein